MKNEVEGKQQLMEESTPLRQELLEVNERRAECHWLKDDSSELKCICNVVQVIDRPNITLDEVCQEVTNVMSDAWHYSDIVGFRIAIGGKEFRSSNYHESGWKRAADIRAKRVKVGTLEIYCSTMRHTIDETQSLEQKGFLIDFVAALIGRAIERKETGETLRNNEERFRALAEYTSDWVWEINHSFLYTYCSSKCRDLLGFEPEEVLGKPEWFCSLPKDAKQYKKRIQAIFKSQKPFVQLENTNVGKDGQLVILETSGVPFFDTDGRLLGYRGIDRDITARKGVENTLRESEEFSSNLLSTAPNPILVINPDTSIRYVNPALEQLTGFYSSELVGMRPPYLWWAKERLDKTTREFRKAMAKGEMRIEQLFQKKNGELFWAETTSLSVIGEGTYKYHLESWNDLTAQKRLRENMQFYIAAITKAQEEERRRIAHEIHDETIQGLFGLLTDIDVEMAKGTQISDSGSKYLQQLKVKIDNIMTEARRFSHRLRPGVLDEFGLLASLELLIEETQKTSQLSYRIEVIGSQRRLSPEIELALFRVTQEALHNVRKHSRATEAIVRIGFGKGRVNLSIIDNGIGFELPQVLGSFARIGRLGLVGISERIRSVGGGVSIESKVGVGTTVVVEIPA